MIKYNQAYDFYFKTFCIWKETYQLSFLIYKRIARFSKPLFDPRKDVCDTCIDSRIVFYSTSYTPRYNSNQCFLSVIIEC